MAGSTVLLALNDIPPGSVLDAQLARICEHLAADGHGVVRAGTDEDALALVQSRADLGAALVSWELPDSGGDRDVAAEAVLKALVNRFTRLPVFLVTSAASVDDLPLWVSEVICGYVWLLEDTPGFIAGRIGVAARRYRDEILPPFFRELRRFDDTHEYSWHTPAHAGGVAFLKSPVGRALFDYYGERLFRTDLSISVGELGSLFEHTGPIGDAERNAARIFGADLTYFVLHGDSTGDRIALHASVATDELVLVDRNCHKAIYHGLTLTGGRPVYLVPTRNGYGLMGPIPPAALGREAVADLVPRSPLADGAAAPDPVYAVITNSTYDGLCYDAVRVAELLGASVPRLHLDEAWFAYARFHPLYARRYGMAVDSGAVPDDVRPTVLSTQSTHKLLAAMSQSAMLHVKNAPRSPVEHRQFNETFMMHATTSPLYPMIAGLDVAAGMMDGPGGRWLVDEAVTEAIRFRQAVARIGRRIAAAGDRPGWFFGTWQPPEVGDPRTGQRYAFADAPLDLLRTEPSCWTLEPGADWHGFAGLEPGYCLLDPVKVSVTCPGTDARGTAADLGIPARILTAYLETRRIVVEKTDAYTCLILFSMGITKGKWGTLIDGLLDFKTLYDTGARLTEVLPRLVEDHPGRYAGLTLRDLCDQMHAHLRKSDLIPLLDSAFTHPPRPELTPARTYQRLLRGGTEPVRLAELAGRTVATQVVTTPPGIPVLMPGENTGGHDEPTLRYLRALEDFDRHFPGFPSETHGVARDAGGDYWITCLRTG
ncbi:Orn/Lys/Arg decarboxylase N-terminal domain-containing protein [Amycolatopsis australiensis]|uniref:Ornithine decarboxylase /response regulator receiver protein n=1 Tax=Amycolatopsis australiensis TaxID=546364 RepID=A0A1K1RFD3_9PSEU|nr:Orn/Lys/Arg decarboxylase N-terminal domain-containing protein [Amycolatopsis australiensis]SFW70768.1 ornithine decarboxylase /response regulator receiver protein [Amycolatopsis australiensis]